MKSPTGKSMEINSVAEFVKILRHGQETLLVSITQPEVPRNVYDAVN